MKTKIMKWAFIATAAIAIMIIVGIFNYWVNTVAGIPYRGEFNTFIVLYLSFLAKTIALLAATSVVIGGCLWIFRWIYKKIFDN